MQRMPRERIDEELAKADELRDPPVPVWARVMLGEPDLAGELYGWAANPNGADDGWRGLVLAPRQYAPGFWAEFLGWVSGDHIRKRPA